MSAATMSIATALTPQGSPSMSSTGTNTSPVTRDQERFTPANSAPSAPAATVKPTHQDSEGAAQTEAQTVSTETSTAANITTAAEDSTANDDEEKGKFVCPLCEHTFTRHHNLKSHLLTHSHEKPFTCETCNSKFRRLHDLKRHVKLHTGEKPYNCEKCGRKFARGDALVRHMKGSGTCTGINVDERDFQGYQPLQPKALNTPVQQPIQATQPSPAQPNQQQGPLLAPAPSAPSQQPTPQQSHPAPESSSPPPAKKRSISPYQNKSPPSFGAPGGGGVPAPQPSTRHVSHLPPPQMYVPSHHSGQAPPPPHGRGTMLPYPAATGAPGSTEEHLLALVKTLESRIWSLEERIHVTESRIAFLESSQRPH
ncbi:Transcriptional regulator prz1 [Yarrowia sp. B02]|nr:Transcriptional regulator prz1 [Yarrowia sp. B02]